MKNKQINDIDPRVRREQLRRQEIHLAILQAAEKIIIAKGFSAMTMNDVASEARLSKATLYKYIPSRNRILYEIVSRHLQEWENKVRRIVESRAKATEKLQIIISDMLSFHHNKSNINRILLMDGTTMKFMRVLCTGGQEQANQDIICFRSRREKIMQLLAGVIEDGVAQGEFRSLDPGETVYFISSLLIGIFHASFWKVHTEKMNEEELSKKLFEFIYPALRNPAGCASSSPAKKPFFNTPKKEKQEK